jgi:hypothetical protein
MPITLLANTFGGGTLSIRTGSVADLSPHTDPLDHLDKLKFHSGLDYTKLADPIVTDVTFPARTTYNAGLNQYTTPDPTTTESQNLVAHGISGFPWVLAAVEIGGIMVPFTGSVPVQQGVLYGSGSPPANWVRWVTVGADETYVNCFEYCVVTREPNGGNNVSGVIMAEITLPITVWVTNVVLE